MCFCRVEVTLFKGIVRNTNDPMSTLFIGSEEAAYLFAEVAYSKIDKVQSLGKYPSFEVNPRRLPSAEIFVSRVGKVSMGKFVKNDYVVLPSVSFSLDLSCPTCEMLRRMSRRRRRDLQKLKAYNYSYAVCRNDEKSFDFFYRKMYYPYTTKRFGKATMLRSYLEAKARYRNNGGIIFIRKDDKPIAGILFQIHGKTLRALNIGVYEGRRELLKELACQAALFFLIEWAKMEGMNGLNYGYTVPFLTYGNFQYKKEWGMFLETEAESEPFCALKINHLSKGSLSFLSQNPFIFSDKGSMKGIVFTSHKVTEAELEHITHEYLIPKLDSLVVISYGSEGTESVSKPESSERGKKSQDLFARPLSDTCMLLEEQGLNVKTYEYGNNLKVPQMPKIYRGESSQSSGAVTRWVNRFMYREILH